MTLFPDELALANLRGEISSDERGYMPHEEAYAWLKKMSNEDFGDNTAAWADWVERQKAARTSNQEAG
jgi:hypothetical protein